MPETETGRHRSEVGGLLVSPDLRRRGLARGLMAALEGVAREKGRWMVVCFDSLMNKMYSFAMLTV